MTRMSAEERRRKLGSSRDKSLKRFDDVFPDNLSSSSSSSSSIRPRLVVMKRSSSSPWEDTLPRVREESVQEISAEEKRNPTQLRRHHTWNMSVRIPADISNRLGTVPLRVRPIKSDGSSSSLSSFDVEASDDEVACDKLGQNDTCQTCGNQIPDLDRNLNFIERSLNKSSDTEDGEDDDDGIVCRPSLQFCMPCRISQEHFKNKPLSRENSVPDILSLRSPPLSPSDFFKAVISDLSPVRRSSFAELSELPSIWEPAGDDFETTESKKSYKMS